MCDNNNGEIECTYYRYRNCAKIINIRKDQNFPINKASRRQTYNGTWAQQELYWNILENNNIEFNYIEYFHHFCSVVFKFLSDVRWEQSSCLFGAQLRREVLQTGSNLITDTKLMEVKTLCLYHHQQNSPSKLYRQHKGHHGWWPSVGRQWTRSNIYLQQPTTQVQLIKTLSDVDLIINVYDWLFNGTPSQMLSSITNVYVKEM